MLHMSSNSVLPQNPCTQSPHACRFFSWRNIDMDSESWLRRWFQVPCRLEFLAKFFFNIYAQIWHWNFRIDKDFNSGCAFGSVNVCTLQLVHTHVSLEIDTPRKVTAVARFTDGTPSSVIVMLEQKYWPAPSVAIFRWCLGWCNSKSPIFSISILVSTSKGLRISVILSQHASLCVRICCMQPCLGGR